MTKPPEWQIPCPRCHAPSGRRCTTPRGRPIAIDSHDARITAWTTRNQQTGEPA